MKHYEGMLPAHPKPGRIGYYPVTNKQEWNELPDLYKVMEWRPVKDPYHKDIRGYHLMRAVKSVIFDVTFMEPYGISGKFHVHPCEVQKLLFCNYGNPDCQLYTICGVELEGGTRLGAKWQQDTTTGAFAVYVGGIPVGIQGGFIGHIPDCIDKLPDGSFKHNWKRLEEKVFHYTLGNPYEISFKYRDEFDKQVSEGHPSLGDTLQAAASRTHTPQNNTSEKAPEPERS